MVDHAVVRGRFLERILRQSMSLGDDVCIEDNLPLVNSIKDILLIL